MGPTINYPPLLEDLKHQEEAEEEEDKSDSQSGKSYLAYSQILLGINPPPIPSQIGNFSREQFGSFRDSYASALSGAEVPILVWIWAPYASGKKSACGHFESSPP